MSTQFYNRMNGVATNLLTRFGHTISLVDENRNVLDSYQGLKTGLESENVPASVLEASTAVVYLSTGTIVPSMGQYLQINNIIYRITYVDNVELTDVGLLYKVFVSDGA